MEGAGCFTVEEQAFWFKRYVPEKWRLTIGQREVECLPAVCSASTPRQGLTGEVCRTDSRDVRGKVVLVESNKVHESILVEALAQRGAAAALLFQRDGPLLVGRVAYPISSIPCMMITGRVGMRLRRDTSTVKVNAHLYLRGKSEDAKGTNVYARPKVVTPKTLFVGHRDSRLFSPGAIDNASGTSLLAYLTNRTLDPSYSLLSTDAEEYGLRGSRQFVAGGNSIDLKTAIVNLDSIGSGPLHLVRRSRGGLLSKGLIGKISAAASGIGISLPTMATPRGSDCDPFLEKGYRCAWLRSYPTPTATTVDDKPSHVRKNVVAQACRILRALSGPSLV